MTDTATIKLRGKEYEVTYQDYGYESDTNAHVIEWDFVGEKPDPMPTDAEDQSIYEQLGQISYESHGEDYP